MMCTTENLLAERDKTHGDYDYDARCAMKLVNVVQAELAARQNRRGQTPPPNSVQLHSLIMILFKVARIVAGDPYFKDHWDDIAGYAKLVADRCP